VTDKDDAYLALAWGSMPNLIRQIKIGKALDILTMTIQSDAEIPLAVGKSVD